MVAVAAICFATMFITMSKSTDRLPLWMGTLLYEIGTSTPFIALYLFMAFLLLDLLRLVHIVPKTWIYSNGIASIGLFILMMVVFICGNVHYNSKHRHEINLTTDKNITTNKRIVLISDLHLGYNNHRKELARWVDLLNSEHPDIILVAGDIIDMSMRPLIEEDMAAEFRRLEAPVYACLGNHEYYAGTVEAEDFYRSAGIHLLRDDMVRIGNITIIGRDDRTNKRRRLLSDLVERVDKDNYIILLDHQPYKLEQAERAGIDFQFSGHTHHGQVFPISLITENIYEVAYGSHQRGKTQYYVSSGLGIWGGKYRIGTCSEYVVANLIATE